MRVIALFYSIILIPIILLTNVVAKELVMTALSDSKGKLGISEEPTKTAGDEEKEETTSPPTPTPSSDTTSTTNSAGTPIAEYKKLGDRLLKEKQITKAMEAYKQFIDNGGKNQVVAQKLGNHYHKLKQYEEAVKYLSMVTGNASQSVFHLLKLADANYCTKNYTLAVILYKKLNAKNLKVQIKRTIRENLVKSYIGLDEKAKALYWVNQYMKLGKTSNKDIYYLGAFLQEKSDPAKAKTLYAANTKRFTTDYRNFLRLGLMYSTNKATLSESVILLKKAVTLVDTIPTLWLEIAGAYGKLGKIGEELDAYKRYIKIDPENLEANIRVGLILLERNNVSEGMGYLEKANKKAPKNIAVIVALAKGYTYTKQYDKAVTLLNGAKEIKKGDLSIHQQLFDIYQQKGQDDLALNEIKQLIEIQRNSETLLLYAQLLMKTNDLTGAENAIEDIRATDPEDIEALMLLATIKRTNKNLAEAIELYKEVIIIDPQYAAAIHGQAQIYLLQNKILWAEKYFKKALQMVPSYALAELGLAKIAKIRKDTAAYKKHLNKAYLLDPKDKEILKEYNK